MEKILLCTDMDRTIIPNGNQAESRNVRESFARLIKNTDITLVYITGRSKELILEAIQEYNLPEPEFAIGDVGASIYSISNHVWVRNQAWDKRLLNKWHEHGREDIDRLLKSEKALSLQDNSQQSRYKISYYCSIDNINKKFIDILLSILNSNGLYSNIVWSINEEKKIGLIDILPAETDKYHAMDFLVNQLGFDKKNVLFAGDSGNDLQALTSPYKSVLVKNARNEIKNEAKNVSEKNHRDQLLYIARGISDGLNGCYAGGVIEGLVHFFPEIEKEYNEIFEKTSINGDIRE